MPRTPVSITERFDPFLFIKITNFFIDLRRNTPCLRFTLSSSGPVLRYAPDKLGTYELERQNGIAKMKNGRVIYFLRAESKVFYLGYAIGQRNEEVLRWWMVRFLKNLER